MPSNLILLIIMLLCTILSIVFLWKLRNIEPKEIIWQISYYILIMIMLFCGFSFIALAYIYFFNVETIPSNALFFIFGVLSITSTFAVLYFDKRVRFMEALGEDSGPKVTLPSKLKRGNTYLIKDIERKRALRLFSAAIGLNFKGLAITRQNPQNIIETFKLKTAKVIWLTELKNGKNLSPTDLEEISYVINNFINQEKRSIIIFDGFEYLSDYNSFAKVLHLFQVLKDAVSIKNSILLIYINPRTMEKNNIKLLESEFKVI